MPTTSGCTCWPKGVLAALGFLLWFLGLMGLMLRQRVWKGGVLLLSTLVLGLFDYTFFFAGVYYPLLLALGYIIAMSSGASRLDRYTA